MRSNKLNKEEQKLQEKLEQHEMSYRADHWQEMQKMLDKTAGAQSYLRPLKVAMVMAVLGAVAYFSLLDYATDKKHQTKMHQQQKMEAEKVEKNHEKPHDVEITEVEKPMLVEAEEELTEETPTLAEKYEEVEVEEMDESQFPVHIASDTAETRKMQDSIALFIVAPEKPCLYTTVKFRVKNRNQFSKVIWKMDGKVFPSEYQFFEPGEYLTTAEAYKNGNWYRDTLKLKLYPEPEFDFTYKQMEGIFDDFSVQFFTESELPLSWNIEGEIIEEQEPFYNFKKDGLYDVTAFTVNENGCTTELYKPVAVMKDFFFYAPDAFTPNGDGINDIFLPPVLEEIEHQYTLSVYDLSGTAIFSTSEKGKGWNGRMNNEGKLMPTERYVWRVVIRNEEGKQRRFTGSIRIVEFD